MQWFVFPLEYLNCFLIYTFKGVPVVASVDPGTPLSHTLHCGGKQALILMGWWSQTEFGYGLGWLTVGVLFHVWVMTLPIQIDPPDLPAFVWMTCRRNSWLQGRSKHKSPQPNAVSNVTFSYQKSMLSHHANQNEGRRQDLRLIENLWGDDVLCKVYAIFSQISINLRLI